jgi:hypothetical protein
MKNRILIVLIILLTTTIIVLLLANKKSFSQSIVIGAGAELNLGNGVDVCATTYGNITGNVTGSGTSCNQAMPVEMMNFSALVNLASVTLHWQTASEENNRGFEIFRSASNTKLIWYDIGFVRGSGTKNTPTNYTYTENNLKTGKYYYRIKQMDNNGNMQYFDLNNLVEVTPPGKFELQQNYPNPFNPVTKISFTLPSDSRVSLKIYDISGREVSGIINDKLMTADYYTYEFNASKLSSGIYFYKIVTDKFSSVKKMVVIK